jgi:SH3-like domain-containing protein
MRLSSTLKTLVFLVFLTSAPAGAQEREVPYWASIQAETVNMRVGPGPAYPIEWVYRRPGLPVKVIRVMQGWRLVRDPEGAQGWIVGRLLTRERGAIVVGEGLAELRAEPDVGSALRWRVEPGVVGRLGECQDGWCELDVGGRAGWIEQNRIWGAGEP